MVVPMTFTEAESSPGSGPVYVPAPFLETCDVGHRWRASPEEGGAGAWQVGQDTCLSEGDSG